MAGLNKWTGLGNLVANAETRYTQSGQAVTSMRIACNETYFSNNEKKERTEFVNLVLWGKRGPAMAKANCLNKGQQLFVRGRLQTRSYEAQDGSGKRWVTEIVVGNSSEDLQLLGARRNAPEAPEDTPPPPSDSDVPQDSGDDFKD